MIRVWLHTVRLFVDEKSSKQSREREHLAAFGKVDSKGERYD
jgi:hypothetical protein